VKWIADETIQHLQQVANWPDLSETKYLLVREIARGGMGTVYLAQDTQLNRYVAVKVLHAFLCSAEMCARMLREAQIIARLEHPGIVPIHDIGELPDGRIFYAMKLVRGARLDAHVKRLSSPLDRLRIFQTACEAVAFAHAHGIVHRDLKPQNIMVGPFNEVLILDWGVAKILEGNLAPLELPEAESGDEPPLPKKPKEPGLVEPNYGSGNSDTDPGTMIGTPAYVAPEQALGQVDRVNEKADVYSLGAVLYFLLTGEHPPDSGPPKKVKSLLLFGPARDHILKGSINKALTAICMKAMARDPAQRYTSATALVADIARFVEGRPVSAYHESLFERSSRWVAQNQFLVFLVIAYLLMRIFFILAASR
jgi:serine/threonine protein kinase